ncbi:MAG: phosphomannomutase/phosphoglucomutase [Gammaproteobacteria bacterium]
MVEGPITQRRFKRRTVRNVAIISVALVVALLAIVGGRYFYNLQVEKSQAQSQAALEAAARDVADKVLSPFKAVTAELNTLVRGEEIVSLFKEGDPDALAAQAENLGSRFDSVLKLRLLLPGGYELDSEAFPPLSYASLDLLRRAEKTSGPIGAEVMMFGSPKEHIVLIQRVKDKGGVLIGLFHLSLGVDVFDEVLTGLGKINAYIEVNQHVAGKKLVLGNYGDKLFRHGDPITVAVNDTHWNISYWGEKTVMAAEPEASGSGSVGLIIMVIVLLVMAGGAVFFFKQRRGGKGESASQVVYEGAIKAIMEGAHPGMEKLIPHLPKMGQVKTIRPVSAGMEGEDITKIARPAEAQIPTPAPAPAKAKAAAGSAGKEVPKPTVQPKAEVDQVEIDPGIFRAYDIRGIVGKTLTVEAVHEIGRGIGSEAHERGQQGIAVGRDGRNSGPELADALIKGLRATGRDVIDIGMVPTPVLYFATHFLDTGSGVMITGSHNPPAYNGLKIMLGGETLSGENIQAIYNRIKTNNFNTGEGDLQIADISADYLRRVSEDIPVALGKSFKIVIDCGNGVAGSLAPQLFRALGHDVEELYCEVDGNFPNHHPDPSQPENLEELIAKVKEGQADIGFAFDGDGDRLGVIDGEGNIIWPDRQLMLMARDVLSRNQGAKIIFDVKCSRHLKTIIEASGGEPLMWKTGHSLIKSKMKEVDAPLAGEMSGHIFFKERWYGFDDAMYAAARLVEILTNYDGKPVDAFAELPGGIATPELRLDMVETEHAGFMQTLQDKMPFEGAEVVDIDGLRIEYADGWGLIRPSNTSPCLVMRFEADNQTAMERIQSEFRGAISQINPELQIPF